jgi:hypothetical protein
MTRRGWHISREAGALVLARDLPVRFDVRASAAFPPARKGRLANQIRQDMWRALRDLRGFSPVVVVEETAEGLAVTAGGRAASPFPKARIEACIAALLASAAHRRRWLAHAAPKETR